jgi:glycine hydroxymethyltransferase
MLNYKNLKKKDKKIFNLINKEEKRQFNNIELIASENIVDPAVLEAVGTVLTNKYAEGYPGKRYYGGCEIVDEIEKEAIHRCNSLFKSKYCNVQPHSGSSANMAAYFSVLNHGDKIMALSLSEGGHLTHGSPVNFSGKLFNIISYGVDKKTEKINYTEIEKIAKKENPKLIVTGATAYSRIINFKKFKQIAKKVNAYLMVDMAHFSGLVAAGLYPTPVKYADIVTSTTHKTLRGPRGGIILTNSEKISNQINKTIFPGLQGGPLMHIIAGKAVCFKLAKQVKFKKYQSQILKNAKTLSDCLKNNGFRIVSGGTDTHLFIIDTTSKNITGKLFEEKLDEAGITANKNTIPYDKESPFVTSGVRIGTPAVTSRGMKEKEMKLIAEYITYIADNYDKPSKIRLIKKEVRNLVKKFPINKIV